MGDTVDGPDPTIRPRNAPMPVLVFGLSVSLVVVLWGAAFAAATTCTNNGGVHCGRVDSTLYVAIGAGVLAGVMALFGPWPRRHPSVTYVLAVLTICSLAIALMSSWSA